MKKTILILTLSLSIFTIKNRSLNSFSISTNSEGVSGFIDTSKTLNPFEGVSG